MSIWKKKTDERLSKVEQECKELIQEGRELQCQTHGGHKWRFVDDATIWCGPMGDGYWSETFTWTVDSKTLEVWNDQPYKFRCHNCDAERLFAAGELSPDQRRELEYLGVLVKKTKKGGKK